MVDKDILKQVMLTFSKGSIELNDVLRNWESGEQPAADFFRLKNLPTRVFIEPTNRCNMQCTYCIRDNMKRSFASLELDDFKRALEGVPKGAYIIMTGNGEPMLNPKTPEMISFARENGFLVGIITNGSRLNERHARRLIEAKPNRVQFSLDSIYKDTFNSLKGGGKGSCSFESIYSNVLDFIRMEKCEYQHGIFITVASVLTPSAIEDSEPTKAFWAELPIDNYYEGPLLSMQSDADLAKKICEEDEPWRVCANPWTSLKVNADGTVNPCIQDYSSQYVIGSVKEEPLSSIINSGKAIQMRMALYNKDVSFFEEIGYSCHRCNAWKSNAKHDLRRYLEDGYPITYGLMAKESSNKSFCSDDQKTALLEALRRVKLNKSLLPDD